VLVGCLDRLSRLGWLDWLHNSLGKVSTRIPASPFIHFVKQSMF
jgi:hypothetical protein